jgi:hypothetical protein
MVLFPLPIHKDFFLIADIFYLNNEIRILIRWMNEGKV